MGPGRERTTPARRANCVRSKGIQATRERVGSETSGTGDIPSRRGPPEPGSDIASGPEPIAKHMRTLLHRNGRRHHHLPGTLRRSSSGLPLPRRQDDPRRTNPGDRRGSIALARVRRLPRVRLPDRAAGHRRLGQLPGLPHGAVPPDAPYSLVAVLSGQAVVPSRCRPPHTSAARAVAITASSPITETTPSGSSQLPTSSASIGNATSLVAA